MTHLIIGVDFDGTVVDHRYPEVGDELPLAVEVLRDATSRGARIVLWTMRSGRTLEDAVRWFAERDIPLWGVNENPEQRDWTSSPKAHCHVYIDDAALGAPVLRSIDGRRPAVDWEKVRIMLEPILEQCR